MKSIPHIFLTLLCSFSMIASFAQKDTTKKSGGTGGGAQPNSVDNCEMSGPSTGIVGLSDTYELTCDGGTGATSWQVTGGTITSSSAWQASITWTSAGTNNTVTAKKGGAPQASMNVNVSNPPPFVTGAISNTSQTINYNTTPITISASQASGGQCWGSYTYTWYSSLNGSTNWTPIANSNVQNYQPGFLTTTTYFKRYVSCAAENGYTSNTAVVTVYPDLNAGRIVPSEQNVNYPSFGNVLSTNNISGGSGTYSYKWMYSNGSAAYTVIPGTPTGATYTPTSLPWNPTFYQVEVNSNGAIKYSVVATVYQYPAISPGTLSPSTQLVNPGGNGSAISLTGVTGGTGTYTYQWQSSTDNSNWSNMGAASANTSYTPTTITQPMYYRVIVLSNGASSSPSTSVYVGFILAGGSISGNAGPIIYNTSPGLISSTQLASGGLCSGNYTYTWESSSDGSSWYPINGVGNVSSYTPGQLASKTYYRRNVSCPGSNAYSNILTINVASLQSSLNYIEVRDINRPGISNLAAADLLSNTEDVKQVTEYFDGIGRSVQTVSKKASPASYDVVSPVEYDAFGRVTKKYMPYVSISNDGIYRPNAFADQLTSISGFYPNEQAFYNLTVFEASPLNRVLKSFGSGVNWAGTYGTTTEHAQQQAYLFNTTDDQVRYWRIENSAGSLPVSISTYEPGELYKNITTDEENHQVVEYKDKAGNIILKKVQVDDIPGIDHNGWLCTYYVFDDFNQLRFVIQPKAVKLLPDVGWTITQEIADELCFSYEFDKRKRMVLKHIPGAKPFYMIYDKRDRLVMTQDGNLRKDNKWLYTKYDLLNRPIISGAYIDNTYIGQTDMQVFLESQDMAMTETYTPLQWPNYTVDQAFPSGNFSDVLLITYYDDYSWGSVWTDWQNKIDDYDGYFSLSNNSFPYPETPTAAKQSINMVTAMWKKTTGQFNFYDIKGRAIQSLIYNQSTGRDIQTNQYSFNGMLLQSVLRHQKGGGSIQEHLVSTKFSYDAMGRLLTVKKNIISSTINGIAITNGLGEKTIVTNTYNELGQMFKKEIGNKPSGGKLETLSYEYNVRGWLLGINRNYLNTSSGSNYFGIELAYDNVVGSGGASYTKSMYNGNIAGSLWKSKGDGVNRKYDFTYDNLNRLIGANFSQSINGGSYTHDLMDFSVENLSYDENGNILTMTQKGFKLGATSAIIDQLNYTYYSNSNKLKNVRDQLNDPLSKLGDFKTSVLHPQSSEKSSATNDAARDLIVDYKYDDNGNLAKDFNKDICDAVTEGIEYNYLNQPVLIHVKNKGTISYEYEPSGVKLSKTVTDILNGNTIVTTTKYISGFVYESRTNANDPSKNYSDVLQYLVQEEGRIRFKEAMGNKPASFVYDYMIKDHLGNVRMILTEEQDQSIYPAATFEYTGSSIAPTDPVAIEQNYYYVDPTKIVSKSTATGITDYQNNNGNPPVNNNPNCSDNSNIKQTDLSAKLYQLNGNTNKTGLGITLKVMAGDKLNIYGKSYYFTNATGGPVGTLNDLATEVLTGLLGTPGGIGVDKLARQT